MRSGSITQVAATVALSALALSAAAADGGWYGGLGLGRSSNRFDIGNFSSGVAGVRESQHRNDSGFKVFGGYQFDPYFGVEGGYADLGKFSYDYSGTTSATSHYKVHAWSLAATGTAPLGQGFSMFGKLGVALTHAADSLDDSGGLLAGSSRAALLGSGSHNRTSAMWGAGLEYAFNRTYSLRGEYEDYGWVGDQGNSGRARDAMWSVGLKMKF